jgi:hypothetical protein
MLVEPMEEVMIIVPMEVIQRATTTMALLDLRIYGVEFIASFLFCGKYDKKISENYVLFSLWTKYANIRFYRFSCASAKQSL